MSKSKTKNNLDKSIKKIQKKRAGSEKKTKNEVFCGKKRALIISRCFFVILAVDAITKI